MVLRLEVDGFGQCVVDFPREKHTITIYATKNTCIHDKTNLI